jgi:uncharacterized protein YjiS (DUF1127 family)
MRLVDGGANRKRLSIGTWLSRLLDTFIEAQKRKAGREIRFYLQTLSDNTLKDIGFTDADIATLRAGAEVDFSRPHKSDGPI